MALKSEHSALLIERSVDVVGSNLQLLESYPVPLQELDSFGCREERDNRFVIVCDERLYQIFVKELSFL